MYTSYYVSLQFIIAAPPPPAELWKADKNWMIESGGESQWQSESRWTCYAPSQY